MAHHHPPHTQRHSLQATTNQSLAEPLFNSIGEGAFTTDQFGKITRINDAALRMLGYHKSDLIGEWLPKKIIAVTEEGKMVELIDRPITRAFLTGKPISTKTLYRKKDGSVFPVSLTVSPIISDGHPIGAIEVFRDITLQDEIDRMKSEFISLASHQLRTPLSAIKTYAHMLLDGYMGELNDDQHQSLHTIIGAANRMNELISTLLNVTRIEAGTVAISPKPIKLVQLVEEVIKEHTFQVTDKSLTMVFKQPKSAPIIKTDPLIAKEILANLISNSIKYTPPGGTITLRIKPRRHDVLISVADNGFGIPRFAQDQIFTKFFRAQNAVRQETSGTGLGLYLVRGLVEALGGKIWFESEENQGTTFFVTLPKREQGLRRSQRLTTPQP